MEVQVLFPAQFFSNQRFLPFLADWSTVEVLKQYCQAATLAEINN
ncbi:MAG TPA: hypothetical protein PLH29_00420 [bacterium]|nr:hypothetical protein [bacterium]